MTCIHKSLFFFFKVRKAEEVEVANLPKEMNDGLHFTLL